MRVARVHFHAAPARPCRLCVGSGALARLARDLERDPPGTRFIIVGDSNVAPLYAGRLARDLRARGLRVDRLTFRAGEASKNRITKARIEDGLLRLGAGRDAALIALGGGVTGDLAGFVAATWYRGVPVVQVPTSLLSMVDSALGGKTAVNLPAGKNLVGSFHQPWGVYADTDVLATLPEARYREGFAEMVKTAAVADARLFERLERDAGRLRERDGSLLARRVAECLAIKAKIVARDEREAGSRAMLNFGHTVGHALEVVRRYRITHGRAVAVGMRAEARIATEVRGFPPEHVDRLDALLNAFGLPSAAPRGVTPAALSAAARADKKARRGSPRYALPVRLGAMPRGADPAVEVPAGTVRKALRAIASR